jgi:nitrate reductase gamma subunit
MSRFLWGVYPYVCIVLFFAVPVMRMVYRPFSWSTRASGLFGRSLLGAASLLLHWGLLLVLLGHLLGLFGGLVGSAPAVAWFFWIGLAGGVMALAGSVLALARRLAVPEVRAMSQLDDYAVHLFLIPILGIALYQAAVKGIFGLAYTAAPWWASLWALAPQPELMASASALSKWHVFLALTFLAYFPFTKLVHLWTYPVNYLVRPYQSVRTLRYRFQRRWELALRSDKSWLVYGLAGVAGIFVAAAVIFGRSSEVYAVTGGVAAGTAPAAGGALMGRPLYVSQCARCHGLEGRGDGPGAGSPTFAAPPRDLTAGQYRFVSTANGVASDEDLRRTIRRGLPRAGMPAFEALSEAQVASLVQVLDAVWVDRPEAGAPIVVPARPPSSVASLEAGARLYQTYCATCHGEHGRGDGPAAVGLPTPPANLAAGEVKAGVEPEQLYLRVAAGVPPFMPSFRTALTGDELWAVIDYVEAQFLRR